MDIRFMAGTTPVTLSRHWFTGAMLLQSATEKLWVQHPLHPGTHFSFSLVQSWLRHIAGHEDLDREQVPASDDPTLRVARKRDPGPLFPWARVLAKVPLQGLE